MFPGSLAPPATDAALLVLAVLVAVHGLGNRLVAAYLLARLVAATSSLRKRIAVAGG